MNPFLTHMSVNCNWNHHPDFRKKTMQRSVESLPEKELAYFTSHIFTLQKRDTLNKRHPKKRNTHHEALLKVWCSMKFQGVQFKGQLGIYP